MFKLSSVDKVSLRRDTFSSILHMVQSVPCMYFIRQDMDVVDSIGLGSDSGYLSARPLSRSVAVAGYKVIQGYGIA